MPKLDFICPSGHEQIDVMARYGERPACPECGSATEILWRSSPRVVGDEMNFLDRNLMSEPIRFTSRSERRRVLKQLGVVEKVRHVGQAGTDKSPHTTRWI